MDRKEETKAVKKALITAGFDHIRVGHDHGTAWGWLTVHHSIPHIPGCTCFFDGKNPMERDRNCTANWDEIHDRIVAITQTTTGRHGDYDGRIAVDLDFLNA